VKEVSESGYNNNNVIISGYGSGIKSSDSSIKNISTY
jgi:hypothetical protein